MFKFSADERVNAAFYQGVADCMQKAGMTKEARGLIGGLLAGFGPEAIAAGKRIVTHTGAVDGVAINKLYPAKAGLKNKILHFARTAALGNQPVEVTKQRFLQGGVLGKGGILRSSFVPSKEVQDAINQGGLLHAVRKHPLETIGDGMNVFGATVPFAMAGSALARGDREDAGKAFGEGLGWTVAAPFGMVGGPLIANRFADLGQRIASRGTPPEGTLVGQ